MSESLRLEWDDSLETGVKLVDIQHKYLIHIINELAEAIEMGAAGSAVGRMIVLLKEYTVWHFGREELCMDRFQCPAADGNKNAHALFIKTFEAYQKEFREHGGGEEIALRMHRTLTDWFVGHIKGTDTQLGCCAGIKAAREAGEQI